MASKRKLEKLAKAKTELEQIDSAITAIISGAQSYSIGTRSLTRADLATLYKRKNTLDDLIDALSGGNGRFRRVIPVG
jgi:ATP-dependent exoDNAse (exonuclease V) beta subunit